MADSFHMVAAAITSTSTVTMLSPGPTSVAIVRSLSIHNNHTASTAAVTVVVTNLYTTSEYVVALATQVSCQQTINVFTQPIIVGNDDTLRIKADPAGDVHAVLSYLRIS